MGVLQAAGGMIFLTFNRHLFIRLYLEI